jgi:hypothetical protein
MVAALSVFLFASGIIIVFSQDATLHQQSLDLPITHKPTYIGAYPFIIGSGVLFQAGFAYSYVVINSSMIRRGDSFLALPALNALVEGGPGIVDNNNFTVQVHYYGSNYPSTLWINFSIVIPQLGVWTNSSQKGIGGEGARSSAQFGVADKVDIFSQIAPVINEYMEFEFYFYVGNSSTPVPTLTLGPPN